MNMYDLWMTLILFSAPMAWFLWVPKTWPVDLESARIHDHCGIGWISNIRMMIQGASTCHCHLKRSECDRKDEKKVKRMLYQIHLRNTLKKPWETSCERVCCQVYPLACLCAELFWANAICGLTSNGLQHEVKVYATRSAPSFAVWFPSRQY